MDASVILRNKKTDTEIIAAADNVVNMLLIRDWVNGFT
jgi:hypothetical protein